MIHKYFSALKTLLFATIIFISPLNAETIQLERSDFFAPSKLGPIELFHDSSGFSIVKDGEVHPVQNCFVDKTLRNIPTSKLHAFLGHNRKSVHYLTPEEFAQVSLESSEEIILTEAEKEEVMSQISSCGYLSVNQMSDGEYTIKAHNRMLGAGPGFGWLCYLAGRGVVYGLSWTIQAVVVSAVTITTGPITGAVVCQAIATAMIAPTEIAAQWVGVAGAVVGATIPTA